MSLAPVKLHLPASSVNASQAVAAAVDSSAAVELGGVIQTGLTVTGECRTDFHRRRRLALFRPAHALAELGPYARLHLRVVKARNLQGDDLLFGDAIQFWKEEKEKSADPYVKVLINDVELCSNRKDYCHRTLEPVWNWEVPVLDIKSAGSTVRLEVMDLDHLTSDDMCGFVEFFVADLPPGETLSGWFHLSPRSSLARRAPSRISSAYSGYGWKGCGAVYAEVRLEIVSGILSDEWYAHCLPRPSWVSYPRGGFIRGDSEPFDAQAMYDRWSSFSSVLVQDLLLPCGSGILYFCSCRDPVIAVLIISTGATCCIYPRYALGIFFISIGIFFSCLARTTLRRRISASPMSANLDQAGFETVALLDDAEEMVEFMQRVVQAMSGRVLDKERLLEFASLSFSSGRPLFDYETLRQKLRNEGNRKLPFVCFDRSPHKQGEMVEVKGKVGQIYNCLDPENTAFGKRSYTIQFIYDNFKEVVQEDQLDMHIDLQWLNNPAVHMFIPKVLERRILQAEGRIEDWDETVKRFASISYGIVSWQFFCTSSLIFLVLMATGGFWLYAAEFLNLTNYDIMLGCAALFSGFSVLVMIAACVSLNGCCRCCRAYRRAATSFREHRRKDARNWAFFEEDAAFKNSQTVMTAYDDSLVYAGGV